LKPEPCSDEGLEKKCNADFLFHMEYKIFPYSLLMLALVPQFLARSAELACVKLCFNKKTFAYESKYKFKDSRTNRHLNFELDDTTCDSDFRELPVDCPSSKTDTHTAIQLDLNNNENKGFSEYYNCEEGSYEGDNEGYAEIKTDILENSQVLINFPDRKVFARSSSLSTIAEEKTMNTDSSNSAATTTQMCRKLNTGLNGRLVIKDLLCEMQSSNAFINEIFHVFEASSKMGNFSRNVPIRFSSPLKGVKDTKVDIF